MQQRLAERSTDKLMNEVIKHDWLDRRFAEAARMAVAIGDANYAATTRASYLTPGRGIYSDTLPPPGSELILECGRDYRCPRCRVVGEHAICADYIHELFIYRCEGCGSIFGR